MSEMREWVEPELEMLELNQTMQGPTNAAYCDEIRTDTEGNSWFSYSGPEILR